MTANDNGVRANNRQQEVLLTRASSLNTGPSPMKLDGCSRSEMVKQVTILLGYCHCMLNMEMMIGTYQVWVMCGDKC